VSDFRPDVVHAHWWIPGGWVASTLNLPFLITCHGSDVRLLERPVFRWLARPVFRRAQAVTTVSRFLAADVQRLLPGIGPVPRVMAMPVDVQQFTDGRAAGKAVPHRILYAGNLVASKGVDVLLRAYGVLRAHGIVCQLKLLGEGSAEPSLRKLARELGLPDVEWSSFVPQDRMPAEYGAATVTVLPTLGQAEGLGLTLVEALLAGSAVVGTMAGGIPEVIRDGETGLLVPGGDVPALAAALERMLTQPDFRAATVVAGASSAMATYAPERAVAPFLALYRELARG
jgi:glycosyltransferase involved in cell wall biosynthesis